MYFIGIDLGTSAVKLSRYISSQVAPDAERRKDHQNSF